MDPLHVVRLLPLMERTSGRPEIRIGLIDGPVAMTHSDLAGAHVRYLSGGKQDACTQPTSAACRHGTFVAGTLCAQRNSSAPAICPQCTLLVRPIFDETTAGSERIPSATPLELATAIIECIDAGVRVINLSLVLAQPSTQGEQALEEALNQAVRRGVMVVAAAGNQGTLGSSAITRHPWVVPVVAYDLQGKLMNHSNLGNSIGRRGVGAPGERITSLGIEGKPLTLSGTSVATPFVTGALALLWSKFPSAAATEIKFAVSQAHAGRRTTVVPPLLDAEAAYRILQIQHQRR